eukprot:jgi/Tetstr1/443138/TSEL_031194.t1
MGRRRLFSDEERAERIKISKKKWRDGNRQHIREYRAEYDKENRERTNRSLFEIIPTDAKSKVYVDYEEYVPRAGVTETEVLLDVHKTRLLDEFRQRFGQDTKILISGSVGVVDENFKVSMHLVFPEMYTDNVQERRPLVNLMRSINNKLGLKCGCDVKVYGRNQQFKLVNQAKAKSTRVQIVMDDSDPMDHILTYFADTASDTMRKLQIATFEYVIPQSVIDEHASNPPSTVVDISGIEAWPSRFIRWVEQGRELTPQRVERYADEWKRLDPAKRPSDNRIVMILALLFPYADIENQTLRGFKWYYDVPIDSHIDSLDELEITNKRKRDELEKTKFVYLACPMGSGKTQTMFERMTMLEEDEKSLFNVSRQTLALDIHSKCKSRGLVITNYMDYNYKSDNSWQEYLETQHQIVSQDSIWKLRGKDGKVPMYNILIIDEFQSYLNQWKSNTHNHDGKLEKNWNVFIQLIRNANTVYVLDAFPSRSGTAFIKDLGYDYKVIATPHTAVPRKVRLMDALKDTAVYDTIQLRLGYLRYLKRPVLAFYPYVAPHADRKTIEEIARGAYASAKANTSDAFDLTYEKDCLVMQANMDDTERAKVMADVNTSWSSRGLVISNSTVTVGVSHTDRWFDRVVLCMNRAMNLRDVMQFTFRARNLQSNVIEVHDLGGHTSHRRATDLAHNSRLYKRDPVFKRLVDFVDYECKATDEDCFRYLCAKAGYIIEDGMSDKELGFADRGSLGITRFFKKLDKPIPFTSMIKVVDDTDANIAWDKVLLPRSAYAREHDRIPMLDDDDVGFAMQEFESAEEIFDFFRLRDRIRRRTATTMDKMFWDKVHFKRLFQADVDDKSMGAIWVGGKVGFIRNLYAYMRATGELSPRWRHPKLCEKLEAYMEDACNKQKTVKFPHITDAEAHAIFKENTELTCLSPAAPSGNLMRLNAINKYFYGQSIIKSNRKNCRTPWVPSTSFMGNVMRSFKLLEAPQTMEEVTKFVFPYLDHPLASKGDFLAE